MGELWLTVVVVGTILMAVVFGIFVGLNINKITDLFCKLRLKEEDADVNK